MKQNMCGEGLLYTSNFSARTSVHGLPTSNYRLDMVLSFGSSDWTLPTPPQGSAYLSPLTTGLFESPTGRIISPSKVIKNIKEQKI
jgi:hypothetical protein